MIKLWRVRVVVAGLLLAASTLASLTARAANSRCQMLFDFEKNALSAEWTAIGNIIAAQGPVPEPGKDAGAPQGRGLHIEAKGPGGFYTKSQAVPGDWRQFNDVRLWIFRPQAAQEKPPADVIEVQALESDGRTRFWRKVELTHHGWKQVELPLAWFLWSEGRVPRWDRIDRLGIRCRGKSDLWVDNIAVTKGLGKHEAELTPERLLALAFPGKREAALKIVRKPQVFVASDVEQLDAEALAAHLTRVAEAVAADIPAAKAAGAPGTLLVFSSRDAWQAFLDRFAREFGAVSGPRPGAGFTTQGIATSFWAPALGTLRPVFTHEFVHSYFTANLLLSSNSDWFTEGTAGLYQLRFHPQANFPQLVRAEWERAQPLERLCAGKPIAMRQYWQSVTLAEMLMKSPKYRDSFPRLIEAFQRAGSTDLGPQLKAVLNTDWETITADWREHCKNTKTMEREQLP